MGVYFSFHGRMNRLPYFFAGLLFLALEYIAGVLVAAPVPLTGIIAFILGILSFWMSLACTVQRLHDLNLSGWFAILIWIPILHFILWLILLFVRGTDGPNQYGPDPLKPLEAL